MWESQAGQWHEWRPRMCWSVLLMPGSPGASRSRRGFCAKGKEVGWKEAQAGCGLATMRGSSLREGTAPEGLTAVTPCQKQSHAGRVVPRRLCHLVAQSRGQGGPERRRGLHGCIPCGLLRGLSPCPSLPHTSCLCPSLVVALGQAHLSMAWFSPASSGAFLP